MSGHWTFERVAEHSRFTDSDTRLAENMLHVMNMTDNDLLKNERDYQRAEANRIARQLLIEKERFLGAKTAYARQFHERRIAGQTRELAAAEAAEREAEEKLERRQAA